MGESRQVRLSARYIAFVVVVTLLVLIAVAASRTSAGPSDEMGFTIASVDGVAITMADLEGYRAVFVAPDGASNVTHDQVLLSLINQRIVSAEARRLGLTITQERIDKAVDEMQSLDAPFENVAGGSGGFADRVRAFLENQAVRAAVVGYVEVDEDAINREFHSNYEPRGLTLDADVLEQIIESIRVDESDRRWLSWLSEARDCASIDVRLAGSALRASTPAPTCKGQ